MRVSILVVLLAGYVVASEPSSECREGLECPGKFPCCQLDKDEYSCCPVDNGVCCNGSMAGYCCKPGYICVLADKIVTCQPQNQSKTTSSSAGGETTGGGFEFQRRRLSTLQFFAKAGAAKPFTFCPDKSECEEGTTCCKVSNTTYGCCPYVNATCCSDLEHCCPEGYTCEEKTEACVKPGNSFETVPMKRKLPAHPIDRLSQVSGVICPGGEVECSSGDTCCKLASGKYGCCPYSKAECCSDHLHCCPNGYACDAVKGACIGGSRTVSLLEIQTSVSGPLNVLCPDGQSQCASSQTCCSRKSVGYGCCPYKDGTCCSDHVHCCPGNYKCGDEGCIKKDGSPFARTDVNLFVKHHV